MHILDLLPVVQRCLRTRDSNAEKRYVRLVVTSDLRGILLARGNGIRATNRRLTIQTLALRPSEPLMRAEGLCT